MASPAVRITAVTKAFGQDDTAAQVFRNFHLTIEPGETTVLMGPNGGGKSTLLGLIAGSTKPDHGIVEVLGARAGEISVGFVVQNYRATLLPWYSVQDNIELPLRLRGAKQTTTRILVNELVPSYGLEALPYHRFPYELSGGQQQVACILRAFAYSPKLLLLDEPTSALDAKKQREVWDLVFALQRHSRPAIVLATHNIDEALLLGDRIVFLGGSPADVRLDLRNSVAGPRSLSDLSHPQLVEIRRQILQMW